MSRLTLMNNWEKLIKLMSSTIHTRAQKKKKKNSSLEPTKLGEPAQAWAR